MRNNFRRFLSVALVLIMALSVMPVGTFAAEETNVAKIGDTEYATLADAMSAAVDGDTIVMLDDCAETFTRAWKNGANVTLDLNGNTFTGTITLSSNSGKLTVKNGTLSPAGKTSITYGNSKSYTEAPDLQVENCTLTSTATADSYYSNKAIVVVNTSPNCGITIKDCDISNLYYTVYFPQGGESFTMENCTATDCVYLCSTSKCKNVTISNVDYTGMAGIMLKAEVEVTLNLSDVKIDVTLDGQLPVAIHKNSTKKVTVNMEGKQEFTANGVAFEDDSWMTNYNNVEVILPEVKAAAIGDATYATLAEAIADAKAGDTVTLLADVTENVTVSKNLTLDGAGYNYTGTITLNKVNATIQNVNFVKGAIYKNKKTGTAERVTVKNCDFDGQDLNDYAINLGAVNYIVIEDCTAKDYGYGFLQVPSSNVSVTAKNVEVSNVNYGFKIDYSSAVVFENVTVKDAYMGIFDSNYGTKTYTIANCNFDAEMPVVIWERANKSNVTTLKFVGVNDLGAKDFIYGQVQAENNIIRLGSKYAKLVASAQIGTKIYGDLKTAIADAKDGDVITIVADQTIADSDAEIADYNMYAFISVTDKAITIDLNGKKITAAPELDKNMLGFVYVGGNGQLTLKDSSEAQTGSITVTTEKTKAYSLMTLDSEDADARLYIEGGNYYIDRVDAGQSMIYANDGDRVFVSGGNFVLANAKTMDNSGYAYPWIFNAYGNNGSNYITVTGGTYNVDPTHHQGEAKFPKGYVAYDNLDGTWKVARGPIIVKQPVDTTIGYNKMAKIAPVVAGEGLTYKWYYKDTNTRWYTSTLTTATYDIKGTVARNGRQIYCVIKDSTGKTVQTETVTLTVVPNENLEIVSQPTEVYGPLDKTITVALDVKGDGLTYKWYFRDKGAKNFQKSSITSATYDLILTTKRMDREVYCEITDAFGSKVTTDIITLKAVKTVELKINAQPTYEAVAIGETVKVKMDVQGEYLTYKWYFRSAGSTKWTVSSIKDSEYNLTLSKDRVGREVYCEITDAFGDVVETEVVTLYAAE